MPEKSKRVTKAWDNYTSRLKRLENVKVYETLKKGALKSQVFEYKKVARVRHIQIKDLDLTFSSSGEWASKVTMIENDNQTQMKPMFTHIFQSLERLSFRLIKTATNFEDIMHFLSNATLIPTLTQVEYEFLNCQISDMEVFAFAHVLAQTKSLKYFCLKVIQTPGSISEDCIEKLAGGLSKLGNISKFDVYFRRLGLHPQGIKDLGRRIESFGNIQCCCSKESIHISKKWL